jgi:hypothetical protein
MAFEGYRQRKGWLASHSDWAFWDGPFVTIGHVNDQPAPPFIYRIPLADAVSEITDLYTHAAASSVIVSPSLPNADLRLKPDGHFIVPAYVFKATRWFLAEPDDINVPLEWRKDPSSDQSELNMSASEQIEAIRSRIVQEFLPLIAQKKMEFSTVENMITLYRQYEPFLDLADGKDLNKFAPPRTQLLHDPSELNASAKKIDFESFPLGAKCPLADGFATITCERPAHIRLPEQTWRQIPKMFNGQLLGYSRSSYTIVFERPVREFGIGLFDVNFGGVKVQAFDKDRRGIRQAVSKLDFPVGPSDGTTVAFIGFKQAEPEISMIKITSDEKFAIDNIYYAQDVTHSSP